MGYNVYYIKLTTPIRGKGALERMKFDKINIYVPEKIGKMLESDADLFEIYKRDGRTINKNRFLSMLIKGYYNTYEEESRRIISEITNLLSELNNDENIILEKSIHILNEIIRPKVPSRKGKNPVRLSLKPTGETETLINHILDDLGDSDYISQYFCRLLMSYCEKSFSEREKIVFAENYKILSEACISGQGLMFNTIWDNQKNHYVSPYKIVTGTEEMFNYLICCEMNPDNGDLCARAFRLNRISKLVYSNRVIGIPENIIDRLRKMEDTSPQYAINGEEEICVKLTEHGEKAYGRIYYGRPKVNRIEIKGNDRYYYFDCSEDQVYLYFRRFDGDDAVIVGPSKLRKRMIDFHFRAYQKYMEGEIYDEHK